jgi:hypothetical protein
MGDEKCIPKFGKETSCKTSHRSPRGRFGVTLKFIRGEKISYFEDGHWIELATDRVKWWVLVWEVLNLWILLPEIYVFWDTAFWIIFDVHLLQIEISCCSTNNHYRYHNWLHGAESFLRSRQLCSYSRISQHFTEPDGSLPYAQEPSAGPYFEPDKSSPYHPILSLQDPPICVYIFHKTK